jgi:Polyketide cyclase / dehydrase and lipid transport
MPEQQETVLIQASPRDVREVLLQVAELPEWNPAFLSINAGTTTSIGHPHPIRVRGGLTGTFQYDLMDPDRIECSWRVRGLRETNHWRLQPTERGTFVTHCFAQRGPLAGLFRGAHREVGQARLARLKARVQARGETGRAQ